MTIALVLPLPGEVAVRLALPTSVVGALPAADLHVTVVVLTAAPPDLVGQVAELVTRFAREYFHANDASLAAVFHTHRRILYVARLLAED